MRLRPHPQYERVLDYLDAVPPRAGLLFWADIERALAKPPDAHSVRFETLATKPFSSAIKDKAVGAGTSCVLLKAPSVRALTPVACQVFHSRCKDVLAALGWASAYSASQGGWRIAALVWA